MILIDNCSRFFSTRLFFFGSRNEIYKTLNPIKITLSLSLLDGQ